MRNTKAYRHIATLQVKLQHTQRRADKFKKRLQRSQKEGKNLESPRTKTDAMLAGATNVPPKAKRALLFHNAFTQSFRRKRRLMKNQSEKDISVKVVASKAFRKYRLKKYARETLGLTARHDAILDRELKELKAKKRKRNQMHAQETTESVRNFYTRDDNSKLTAGKKQTITRGKQKKQKRFLLDTSKNLHRKYLSENPGSHMCYSRFCKLRPCHQRLLIGRHVCAKNAKTFNTKWTDCTKLELWLRRASRHWLLTWRVMPQRRHACMASAYTARTTNPRTVHFSLTRKYGGGRGRLGLKKRRTLKETKSGSKSLGGNR